MFRKGTDRQTDGHGYVDLDFDADQEYIYIGGLSIFQVIECPAATSGRLPSAF